MKNLKFLQLISKFILINILCLVLFASNAQSAKLEDRVSCLISAAQYFEGLDLNYCKKSNGCKDLKGNEFYFVRGSENELGIIVQNLGTRVVYTKNGFAVIESFRDCTELTLNPKNASDKSATSDQKTKFNLIFDKVKFKNCKTSEVKRHTSISFNNKPRSLIGSTSITADIEMVLVEAMKAYSAPKANNLKDTKLDLKTFCSDLAACRDIHKSFPSGPDRVGVVDLMIRANPEAAKSCPKSFDRIETPSTGKPGTSAID